MTQLQLATELGMEKRRAYDYVIFMVENKWIKPNNGKVTSYTSTRSFVKKTYLCPAFRKVSNRPIDSPCRKAPNIKPFRDEWTTLFFGAAGRV